MVKTNYDAPLAQIVSLLEDESLLQASTSGTGTIDPGQDAGEIWNF